MARIRAGFVQRGGGAGVDTDKAKRWGITRLWFEADDPVASKDTLAALRQPDRMGPAGVGLMRDPDWSREMLTNAGVATVLSNDLLAHGFGSTTSASSCGAMFDNERQDAAGIVEMLTAWRRLRPTRQTVWTLQVFQEGWFSDGLCQAVAGDPNLVLVLQAYIDPSDPPAAHMYPADFAEAKTRLLARFTGAGAALDPDRVQPFVDATRMWLESPPYGWSGIVYDFAALPPSPPFPL